MPARRRRRTAAALAALGTAPLVLTALAAAPAAAHGTMGDPVSRVFQCYAEGPESPRSAACKAAVAAGGTQALYDWNGIRIGDANGRHQDLIPDGRLCSANNDEFKGLDLARADWPATSVKSGSYTFRYRVTAQHRGTFTVYITKPGYDPAKPPAWADLDLAHPVATVTDPVAANGFSTFSGTLPRRTGRQLLYAVWQRSDSPEAFYSCSDVTFQGTEGGAASSGSSAPDDSSASDGSSASAGSSPAPTASAPTERQIAAGAARSTVEHHGHGDADPRTTTDPTPPAQAAHGTAQAPADSSPDRSGRSDRLDAAGGPRTQNLAETGGDGSAPYVAVGGAAALALGSAVLFASVRRRAASGGRHGR
ncbi:lytic polysaccharide monooxygenase auxiliary activity family 9 protein [Streptomyces mexicanus]|uniref:Lytic polysaccharide monooxygenase n=1 Tax=Streptomyces mexicanus TaxID=178566 RepID=A0A7X1I0T5_9ACTN|nr:lytic polysaccharide monooxygenase [Streptomyces mexicanus]MBC2866609.1 lytic polysaccharide monooxygenase [Streptomyces mexicanus]